MAQFDFHLHEATPGAALAKVGNATELPDDIRSLVIRKIERFGGAGGSIVVTVSGNEAYDRYRLSIEVRASAPLAFPADAPAPAHW